jgi:gp45 sliding clamp, C terminal
MKLSKETLDILKNFASINPSLIFQAGNVQKTVSPQKTVLAKATISESFTKEFAIYDLTQFISVVSMFEDPSISTGSESVVVSNGRSNTTIRYAKSDLIQSVPAKEIALPSTEISFVLDAISLQSALRAAGVLSLPELALVGREGVAYLAAMDSRNDGSNTFMCEVGKADANYKMIFKLDNLKILNREYEVRVSAKGISHFKSTAGDVEYWIATEQGSTYGT